MVPSWSDYGLVRTPYFIHWGNHGDQMSGHVPLLQARLSTLAQPETFALRSANREQLDVCLLNESLRL